MVHPKARRVYDASRRDRKSKGREIHRSHVQDWITRLIDEGLSQDTIRRCYQILSRIMDDALENHYIEQTPCRKIEVIGVVMGKELHIRPTILSIVCTLHFQIGLTN